MTARDRGILCTVLIAVVLMFTAGAHGQPAQPAPTTSSAVTTVPGTIAPPAPGAPTQPAIAVTSVPSPASPQNPTDQVMWALAMSYLLKYLTQKGWLSFLTPTSSSRIKAFVGFVVAFGTAAGIHLAVNGSLFDAHGAEFTVTGLSFDALKDVGFQWVAQQGWYDTIVKKAATP